jgi:hypothetical protein
MDINLDGVDMNVLYTRFQKWIGHIETSILRKIILYSTLAISLFIIGNSLNTGMDKLTIFPLFICFASGVSIGLVFGNILGKVQWKDNIEKAVGFKNKFTKIVLILYLAFIVCFILFRSKIFALWFSSTQILIVTMFVQCGLMRGSLAMLRTRLLMVMHKNYRSVG